MSHTDEHTPTEPRSEVRMGHVEWAGLTEEQAGCSRDVICAERQLTAAFAAHCAGASAVSVRFDSALRSSSSFDIPVRRSRVVTLPGPTD
jgi:hypothetical protein